MVIRHMPERDAPDVIDKVENGVARVRRAGFDDMRKRMSIAIAGRTDAAGIDDQSAIAKPDRAGEMGVRAKDQGLRDAVGIFLDCLK